MLGHAWFIAVKDLRLFARDRFALLFALLFPFLFATMFYFILSGVGAGDERLELHLATEEAPGGVSEEVLSSLETPDPALLAPGEPWLVWDRDYSQALQAVTDGDMAGLVVFPKDFSQAFLSGAPTELRVVISAEASTNVRTALHTLAQAIASQVNTRRVAADAAVALLAQSAVAAGETPDSDQMAALAQKLLSEPEGTGDTILGFVTEKVGEVEAYNPSNYVIPGYLVMFVFFTAALAAEYIVRERQNQTLERLLAASVRREAILGGIFTGLALKGLIQITLFWLVGIIAFGMDLGPSPGAVMLLSFLMVVMSAAFAVMLATVSKTQRAAGAIAVVASLALAPLGGCWWPLFTTPQWMQFLARLTPHGWATTGFNKLMVFGGDLTSAVPNILVLVGFSLAFAAIALWRFRTSAG